MVAFCGLLKTVLFCPSAVECGWCVSRTHCFYVDQYVLSAPNLFTCLFFCRLWKMLCDSMPWML